MNVLPREKQIEVIAALCEDVGIRTAPRLTGVNRGTVGSLALRVGLRCMELHDRITVGVRTERLELDELRKLGLSPSLLTRRLRLRPRYPLGRHPIVAASSW